MVKNQYEERNKRITEQQKFEKQFEIPANAPINMANPYIQQNNNDLPFDPNYKPDNSHIESQHIIEEQKKNHFQIMKLNAKSNFAYFHTLYEIHQAIFQIITFNFGFDTSKTDIYAACCFKGLNKADTATLYWLSNKYGIKLVNTTYEVLEQYKVWTMEVFKQLANNIISANSIYPNNDYTLNLKCKHIQEAINECEILIQIAQMITDIFQCDESKLVYFVQLIVSEVNQLKNWKNTVVSKYNVEQNQKMIQMFLSIHPNIISLLKRIPLHNQIRYINHAENSRCPLRAIDNSFTCGYINKILDK